MGIFRRLNAFFRVNVFLSLTDLCRLNAFIGWMFLVGWMIWKLEFHTFLCSCICIFLIYISNLNWFLGVEFFNIKATIADDGFSKDFPWYLSSHICSWDVTKRICWKIIKIKLFHTYDMLKMSSAYLKNEKDVE